MGLKIWCCKFICPVLVMFLILTLVTYLTVVEKFDENRAYVRSFPKRYKPTIFGRLPGEDSQVGERSTVTFFANDRKPTAGSPGAKNNSEAKIDLETKILKILRNEKDKIRYKGGKTMAHNDLRNAVARNEDIIDWEESADVIRDDATQKNDSNNKAEKLMHFDTPHDIKDDEKARREDDRFNGGDFNDGRKSAFLHNSGEFSKDEKESIKRRKRIQDKQEEKDVESDGNDSDTD